MKKLCLLVILGSVCSLISACSLIQADTPGAMRNAYCGQPSDECRAPIFQKLDQA